MFRSVITNVLELPKLLINTAVAVAASITKKNDITDYNSKFTALKNFLNETGKRINNETTKDAPVDLEALKKKIEDYNNSFEDLNDTIPSYKKASEQKTRMTIEIDKDLKIFKKHNEKVYTKSLYLYFDYFNNKILNNEKLDTTNDENDKSYLIMLAETLKKLNEISDTILHYEIWMEKFDQYLKIKPEETKSIPFYRIKADEEISFIDERFYFSVDNPLFISNVFKEFILNYFYVYNTLTIHLFPITFIDSTDENTTIYKNCSIKEINNQKLFILPCFIGIFTFILYIKQPDKLVKRINVDCILNSRTQNSLDFEARLKICINSHEYFNNQNFEIIFHHDEKPLTEVDYYSNYFYYYVLKYIFDIIDDWRSRLKKGYDLNNEFDLFFNTYIQPKINSKFKKPPPPALMI